MSCDSAIASTAALGSVIPLTGVNDADYQPPFALTAKLNKLTLKVNRPTLSQEDISQLQATEAIAVDGNPIRHMQPGPQ